MKKELLFQIEQEKKRYQSEGFLILGLFGSYIRSEETLESDIDILYEVDQRFLSSYQGLNFYARIEEIKKELEKNLGLHVDLANKNALDKIGQYFILNEVVYVPQRRFYIVAFRNIIAHEYEAVLLDKTNSILVDNIPHLKSQILQYLKLEPDFTEIQKLLIEP